MKSLYYFSSPATFYPLSGKLIPIFTTLAVLTGGLGLYFGFVVAPVDFQQGEAYRIIFIHVPASWMSMFLYVMMAFWSAIGLAFNTRLSAMMSRAIAPTGALMALLSLWSGAFWGKPMWGTWWVWDARLTSELLLFFLYIAYWALVSSIDDIKRADKAGAILAIVGVVNVPIIYFSVEWWNTLHQGASVGFKKSSSIAPEMLYAMLLMCFAFWFYSLVVAFMRVRNIILEREFESEWLRKILLKEQQ